VGGMNFANLQESEIFKWMGISEFVLGKKDRFHVDFRRVMTDGHM
jgi:hypothetical protein